MSKLSLGVQKAARSAAAAPAPTGPGDLHDTRRLAELEAVIERGKVAFIEVGDALLEIRGSRLYRHQYPTFEAYCQARWGFSRVHAHRLMDAAEIVAVLPTGNSPTSEGQARELVPLKGQPEVMRDVWSGVIERAERDETPITGPVIRTAVRDRIRGMAAESEAELREATAGWTDEQRAAVSPERMRQRGELMRLIHDLNGLPDARSLALTHRAHLSGDFFAEAMWACGWLETFCDALEEVK